MEYRQQLERIKAEMLNGLLSYDQAKAKAQPILDAMNAHGKAIAKKYGKKFQVFTFAAVMR